MSFHSYERNTLGQPAAVVIRKSGLGGFYGFNFEGVAGPVNPYVMREHLAAGGAAAGATMTQVYPPLCKHHVISPFFRLSRANS